METDAAVSFIRSKIGSQLPRVGIVCGSGLGGLQHVVDADSKAEVWYHQIPGFLQSTAQGHEGKLVFGTISGLAVVLLVGRTHYYEGQPIDRVVFPTKFLAALGVSILILTNAAGGLNPTYKVGDFVVMQDHISLPGIAGLNPLIGPNDESIGPRFTPMSDVFDLGLRVRLHRQWKQLPADIKGSSSLHSGVYAWVCGPTYETPAECRMLRTLGADTVAMSTVPEIVTAKHRGLKVMAISLVTNISIVSSGPVGDEPELDGLTDDELAAILSTGRANHAEVIAAGESAAERFQALVKSFLTALSQESS